MNRRTVVMLMLLSVICASGFAARLWVSSGMTVVDDEIQRAVLNLRLISAVSALIVGATLAASGVYLQSLLRNPLASPYILGLAAGAGLGVACVTFAGRWFAAPQAGNLANWSLGWNDSLGATVGALTILFLVYTLSQKRGLVDPISLLLVGVMLSAICGALMMLLQFLSPAADTDFLVRWMMGTISQLTGWDSLLVAGIITIAGIGIGLFYARTLDVAALSEDEARTLGVNLAQLRLVLFVVAGLLTATAVVLAGPIGFVGLTAPHLARIIVGPRHFGLILGSVLIGAALVIFADTGVRLLPRTHGLMPIGIITAGIGGPVFIWLLRRERHLKS